MKKKTKIEQFVALVDEASGGAVSAARARAASKIRAGTYRAMYLVRGLEKRLASVAIADLGFRLSGIVAGCGCTQDEAECCDGGLVDWCYCTCHPQPVKVYAERSAGPDPLAALEKLGKAMAKANRARGIS